MFGTYVRSLLTSPGEEKIMMQRHVHRPHSEFKDV